jgi:hypothetical protein
VISFGAAFNRAYGTVFFLFAYPASELAGYFRASLCLAEQSLRLRSGRPRRLSLHVGDLCVILFG